MSVPLSKKKPSPVQYIETAGQLYKHTYNSTMEFSNRAYDKVGRKLFELASDIYDHVVAANSLRPNNPLTFEMRHRHLLEAKSKLEIMGAQLSRLREFDIVKFKTSKSSNSDVPWVKWSELIVQELGLITGIINSDKKKYADNTPW